MKTIYIKFYDPKEIFPDEMLDSLSNAEIIEECFRAFKCTDETSALMAYANTPCTWSTLLDDSMSQEDVQNWIKEAYNHIKNHDYEWLEEHFT